MPDSLFKNPATIHWMHLGPLGPYIDDFGDHCSSLGHQGNYLKHKVRLVAGLSRWMAREGVDLRGLNQDLAERFLGELAGEALACTGALTTVGRLLDFLAGRGVIDGRPGAKLEDEPNARMISLFGDHLVRNRGLSAGTVRDYTRFAREFLRMRFGAGEIRLQDLQGADVHRFVLLQKDQFGPSGIPGIASALRAFFRYLRMMGHIDADLVACVPSIANRRRTQVPRFIAQDQVDRLLAACPRESAIERRNFAILLLLARLGLRAGEVAHLQLIDIDWGAGEISVAGKGSRGQLPLLHDVGAAIAAYLQDGRPTCSSRKVFLTAIAPYGSISVPTISCIVRDALEHAGVRSPGLRGAHLLRHSLATNLLRTGATLSEIGQILRHRDPDTTAIYAKVDFAALRLVAEPWKGGGR